MFKELLNVPAIESVSPLLNEIRVFMHKDREFLQVVLKSKVGEIMGNVQHWKRNYRGNLNTDWAHN